MYVGGRLVELIDGRFDAPDHAMLFKTRSIGFALVYRVAVIALWPSRAIIA